MKPLITRLGKLFITCPITVYPYDVDFMQIVNNITYLRWFENLRVHLVERFFPLVEMVEQKCAPILSESRIKYLKPVLLSSSPMGSARMTSLTPSRWTIELEIYENDTVYCTGTQSGYYLDLIRKRVTRIPQKFLDLYNNYNVEAQMPEVPRFMDSVANAPLV